MSVLYTLILKNMLGILVTSILLGLLILVLSYLVSPKASDIEKLSAYECGFDPFDDARLKFDVHFYLVSILFLIFDLEIIFLFPWAVYLAFVGTIGVYSMLLFLFILAFAFFYEWYLGALDW